MPKLESIYKYSFEFVVALIHSIAMWKPSLPLTTVKLLCAKPVIAPLSILFSAPKLPYIGISTRLQFIPQPTKIAIVVDSLKDSSTVEER